MAPTTVPVSTLIMVAGTVVGGAVTSAGTTDVASNTSGGIIDLVEDGLSDPGEEAADAADLSGKRPLSIVILSSFFFQFILLIIIIVASYCRLVVVIQYQ